MNAIVFAASSWKDITHPSDRLVVSSQMKRELFMTENIAVQGSYTQGIIPDPEIPT